MSPANRHVWIYYTVVGLIVLATLIPFTVSYPSGRITSRSIARRAKYLMCQLHARNCLGGFRKRVSSNRLDLQDDDRLQSSTSFWQGIDKLKSESEFQSPTHSPNSILKLIGNLKLRRRRKHIVD